MAKSIKDIVLDESPKNVKKITKALEKDSQPAAPYFDAFKAELANGTFADFPKLKLVVTTSFVCYYETTFGYTFKIIPAAEIINAYRTNVVGGEYDYDGFTLAVETDSSLYTLARVARNGKKTLNVFDEVIAEIKKRATSWNRGES